MGWDGQLIWGNKSMALSDWKPLWLTTKRLWVGVWPWNEFVFPIEIGSILDFQFFHGKENLEKDLTKVLNEMKKGGRNVKKVWPSHVHTHTHTHELTSWEGSRSKEKKKRKCVNLTDLSSADQTVEEEKKVRWWWWRWSRNQEWVGPGKTAFRFRSHVSLPPSAT